jgi:leucyl-tRNA synthetase
MTKSNFNHTEIESKWQEEWKKKYLYKTFEGRSQKKKYVLDMFPYPSGANLHVGHLEGYIGTDIYSRYLRMNGFSVFHPMGWDSFGLPAENYAIKTGVPPVESTKKNIETFKRQLSASGLSYDWAYELAASDPGFYRWTQWLFIELFKRGLAYKKKAPVNWCPKDETVLANEQVVDGKCERCDTEVIQKELDQWFFKITDYADRLIEDLDKVDWLPEVKVQQRNWIGRKEGIDVTYKVKDISESITVFTTTPVNFGATFLVLAPDHPFIKKILNKELEVDSKKYSEVERYSLQSQKNKDIKDKEKTGVFSGFYVTNHVTEEDIPVWISDFVLSEVGTGAVQGCPAHDMRDFEFAKKFGIPIKRVVVGEDGDTSEVDSAEKVIERGQRGKMINSDFLNGVDFSEAMPKTMDYFEEKGWGKRVTSYHLRDWLISRQRYWGAPIPVVYCEEHEWQVVPDTDLPILLPTDVDFLPKGESPIATSKTFQDGAVCPICGKKARREVDTMDTFVDSSWYFIRFVDPHNTDAFADPEKMKKWLPVDLYVGGGHVVQHLLFARFIWKVLYDLHYLPESVGVEPFMKLRAPGWILGPDSRKMSKRWGNVITPDDIIPKFGADVLRMYEMFMGPFDIVKPWSITGVEGMRRFIEKVWKLVSQTENFVLTDEEVKEIQVKMNKTIKKVTEELEDFRFNTSIAAIMEYVNLLREVGQKHTEQQSTPTESGSKMANAKLQMTNKDNSDWKYALKVLVQLLAPFAPHMTEELWVEYLNQPFSIHTSTFPSYDPALTEDEEVVIVVQVNGKLRANLTVQKDESTDKEKILQMSRDDESVKKWIEGQVIKNEIFVPGKLVNFVI